MDDFLRCPRYYFYRHVCGFRHAGQNKDLIFGTCWHLAKEALLQGKTIDEAMDLFLAEWRKHYTEDTDLEMFPKNPGNARTALEQYERQFQHDKHRAVTLRIPGVDGSITSKIATEIYGTVSIGHDLWNDTNANLMFKIDSICEDHSGKKYFVDHKTGSMNSSAYQMAYPLSIQMLTYYHVLCCIYGYENTSGGIVDLTLFKKGGNENLRLTIQRTKDMLNEWLYTARHIHQQVTVNLTMLRNEVSGQQNTPMDCFHKNSRGCTAYNRFCSYGPLCMSWSNPVAEIQKGKIPTDFVIEYWNPMEQKKDSSITLSI